MEVTAFGIYLLGTLNGIKCTLLFGAVVCAFAVIINLFAYYTNDCINPDHWRRAKIMAAAGAALMLVNTLTPSAARMAAMIVVPAIINNTEIRGASSGMLKALHALTEKWAVDTVLELDEDKRK